MSTLELKQLLVQKIELIDDANYLIAINNLIDRVNTDNSVFHLNSTQKSKLQISKLQVKMNETKDLDITFDEIDSWLQKR
ncbi:MAG: hypothetical protein ACOYMA_07175 [Bacteroidia bacterium]